MGGPTDWNRMRDRIIGLGEESSRKSFYPELQQQLARFEQAEASLRTLFNAIPDAIFIYEPDGRILEVNDATLSLYGVTRENFRDFSIHDYTSYQTDEEVFRKKEQAVYEDLRTKGHFLLQMTARRPVEGSTFAIEVSLKTARWYDREVIIAVVRDTTERKRLEAMLNQSQKLDALGQFAGGMAHDTNNMLGVIVGYTDLLEERLAGDPQGVEDLDQIRKAAMRSSDLIRQLLAFARKQVIQPRQVDLNQLVEDTQRMLRRLIGENLALVWKPATSLWATWVDPSQVDQILANLVVNARDSIEGSGTITLETTDASVDETFCHAHPDASPGEYVVLSVTDSGKGMTPEVQARIFEPFFTTKETGRGTGLGLATVYGILRQNGGFITVYSVPGSGSCFRLYFPRYAHDAAEDEAPAAEAPPPGGDETLLYVEDEEALLGLGKTILESAGYRVLAMSDPLAAKTLAERVTGTLDLLVTDLVMPGMNGWELWQAVRQARPGIRSLFMSGYPAGTVPAHEVSGRAFLQKPFTRADLLRKVREALDA